MSLTFKDYKINHIALLLIKVLTLSQKTSENSINKCQNFWLLILTTHTSNEFWLLVLATRPVARLQSWVLATRFGDSTSPKTPVASSSRSSRDSLVTRQSRKRPEIAIFLLTVFDVSIVLPSKTLLIFMIEDL